ncbi:MAG: hypothetical protein LBJ10_03480 [Clostridiales bacterium]|nr:hypothetical protein [Clostridiales bacterium]
MNDAWINETIAIVYDGGERGGKARPAGGWRGVCGKAPAEMACDAIAGSGFSGCVVALGEDCGREAPLAERLAIKSAETGCDIAVCSDLCKPQGGLPPFSGVLGSIFDDAPARHKRLLVLNADMPLISPESIMALLADSLGRGGAATIISGSPQGVASGVYPLLPNTIDGFLKKRHADGGSLGGMLAALLGAADGIGFFGLEDETECLRWSDCLQRSVIRAIMRERKNESLMRDSGVDIVDPANTYIDQGVEIGEGTLVYPGCVLEGGTKIGRGAVIGPYARIRDSAVGDGAVVDNSVVVDAAVAGGASVGPFAYLRPGADLGGGTKIGSFVEIKNSAIGEGTKIPHLSYVGDSDVGADVNVGCGTITCNYDGKSKHRTKIGNGAFIGSNSNLVAPVEIAENAYVASGSTITEDVPEDALAIARARQATKEHWVSKKGLTRWRNA